MIACIFHTGSGLGNQLARYVFARVKAADLGVPFGVINPENFKGASFMSLDMGVPVKDLLHDFNEEKVINADGNDVRPYDVKSEQIKDFTLVDGEFQDEKYFEHRLSEVQEWLQCAPIPFRIMFATPEETCVINFRGGEYVGIKDLFLPQVYWDTAIAEMRKKNPKMKFGIVTDDPTTAYKFFPNFDIRHDIHTDWSAINTAHNLILSNSSFAILPTLLNKNNPYVIAPKFWAGYNKGYQQLPQNIYKKFNYIHHDNL